MSSFAQTATASNASFASTSNAGAVFISSGNGKKVYRVRGSSFEVDDTYNLSTVVGHGSYGVVCAAVDAEGRDVAIKGKPCV